MAKKMKLDLETEFNRVREERDESIKRSEREKVLAEVQEILEKEKCNYPPLHPLDPIIKKVAALSPANQKTFKQKHTWEEGYEMGFEHGKKNEPRREITNES